MSSSRDDFLFTRRENCENLNPIDRVDDDIKMEKKQAEGKGKFWRHKIFMGNFFLCPPIWQCRFRYLGRNETTIEESEITTNCLIVNFHFSHFACFRANGFYFHFESRDKKSAKRTEKSCLEIQIIVVRWHFIFFIQFSFPVVIGDLILDLEKLF